MMFKNTVNRADH